MLDICKIVVCNWTILQES